jgi:Flp pilus assembly protein TadG
MPSPAASSATAAKMLRRFRRSRRGSVAVEFALVAPVFFALLFAIIEVAIVFFANQTLETVTQGSARYVMTGQAQNQGFDQTAFKTYVCGQVPALFSCPNLYVDVQSYPAFSNVTINSQIDANNNFVAPTNYNPGGPGSIVVVRVFYQWQLYVTGFGFNISNLAGSKRLLAATVAFQNEPY